MTKTGRYAPGSRELRLNDGLVAHQQQAREAARALVRAALDEMFAAGDPYPSAKAVYDHMRLKRHEAEKRHARSKTIRKTWLSESTLATDHCREELAVGQAAWKARHPGHRLSIKPLGAPAAAPPSSVTQDEVLRLRDRIAHLEALQETSCEEVDQLYHQNVKLVLGIRASRRRDPIAEDAKRLPRSA